MMQTLRYYLEGPLHPFLIHERYYQFRHRPVMVVQPTEEDALYFEKGIDFATLVLLSWPFAIIEAFYRIFGFHLSEWLVENFFSESEVSIYFSRAESTLTFQIFIILLKVVCFPLISWVLLKIWEAIIIFFHNFLGKEESDLAGISQVVNSTLTSHIFLIIPIFGPFIKWLSMLTQLYGGLRYNLRYTRLQTFAVLLSPLIILAFFAFFAVFFFTFFLSELFLSLFELFS